jgi:hypothetical protein
LRGEDAEESASYRTLLTASFSGTGYAPRSSPWVRFDWCARGRPPVDLLSMGVLGTLHPQCIQSQTDSVNRSGIKLSNDVVPASSSCPCLSCGACGDGFCHCGVGSSHPVKFENPSGIALGSGLNGKLPKPVLEISARCRLAALYSHCTPGRLAWAALVGTGLGMVPDRRRIGIICLDRFVHLVAQADQVATRSSS